MSNSTQNSVTFTQELSSDGESWVATCSVLEDLSFSGPSPEEALAGLMVLVRDLRMAELIFARNLKSAQVEEIMRLSDGRRDQDAFVSTT